MCESWFQKERNDAQKTARNAFGALIDEKFNAALAESLTRKFEAYMDPKVASENKRLEYLKQVANNHKWFREGILMFIGMGYMFLMTSGVISNESQELTKHHGFASLLMFIIFWFLLFQLWALAFRLYPKSKAMGICVLALLSITLPIVIFFVDRKAVRFLSENGIRTRLLEVFNNPWGPTQENQSDVKMSLWGGPRFQTSRS